MNGFDCGNIDSIQFYLSWGLGWYVHVICISFAYHLHIICIRAVSAGNVQCVCVCVCLCECVSVYSSLRPSLFRSPLDRWRWRGSPLQQIGRHLAAIGSIRCWRSKRARWAQTGNTPEVDRKWAGSGSIFFNFELFFFLFKSLEEFWLMMIWLNFFFCVLELMN